MPSGGALPRSLRYRSPTPVGHAVVRWSAMGRTALAAGLLVVGTAATACSDTPDGGATAETFARLTSTASAPGGGQGSIPTTATRGADGDQLCPPLAALADAVTASSELDITRPWTELQPDVVVVLGDAAERFAAILAVAPADMVDDVRVLVAYNAGQAAAAATAPSLEEFQLALTAPDDAVNEATAVLDALAEDRCGVGLTID